LSQKSSFNSPAFVYLTESTKCHFILFRFQPVVAFAGEHCHPSFYSTGHGAYLSGRSAAQFFMAVASAAALAREQEEEVYNLVIHFFL
jgi:hypothetical protein